MGIADALASDLYTALAIPMRQNASARPTMFTSGGMFTCLQGDHTVCRAEDLVVTIPGARTDYSNGTMVFSDGPGPVLSLLEQSMINMLIAMRDAYQ